MKKLLKLIITGLIAITSFSVVINVNHNTLNSVNASATLSDGQTLDTNVDVISISDLTFNGQSNQTELTGNKDTDATFAGYGESNVNKSLVFVFKYELNDNTPGTPNSDSKNLRIFMVGSSDKKNKCCTFQIRPDGIYLYDFGGSKWSKHATIAQGKTYNVEFGRIAILNSEGTATGKYYVYYKIDGVEFDSVINTCDVSKFDNSIFVNIGVQHSAENRILDAYGKEDAKIVDLNDISSSPITIAATKNQSYTFDNSVHAANYSLIFRFKYTFNEAGQNQVHINGDDNWGKASSFTLGNDSGTAVRLGKTKADGSDDGWTKFDYDLTVGETYEVEYGRVANVCGSYLLGTYNCYLKINGVIVAEADYVLNQSTVSGNKIFITADVANTFTDCTPADVEETPDIISVSDLKINGELVGNTTVMNTSKSYSYDATASHRSLIYRAKYEVTTLLTGTTDYLQICFGPAWATNSIRLRADKTYIKKDGDGYAEGPKAFNEVGTYELEFGKLYVTEGKHVGMYHLFVKVNGVLIDEYYTSNAFVNNNLFNNIASASQTWSDICIDGHTPGTQVAGVASTCSTHGTLAYYECETCGKKFSDQACTQKLNSLEAPLVEHTIVDGECSTCHAKTTPSFTAASSGTEMKFSNGVEFWKYSNVKVSFDSSYSSVTVDFISPSKTDRVSEKKTLTGTEVIGLSGVFYHYEFDVKDFALNSASGYETLGAWRFREDADYANVVVTGDASVLETADNISVKDLYTLDGKACGKIVTFDSSKKFKWESTNKHGSVVFSFKYTVDEIHTTGEYSYGQFHFTDGYSSNSLWPKNDKTYIKQDGNAGRVSGPKVFTEAGTKTITYGKIYIESGDFAGKYYLFVQADGVTLIDYVTANDYSNSRMFCTLEDGTQWVDVTYAPNQYEVADEITVSDLYLNGKEMPNFITFDKDKEYTYESSATNKSVIFKFEMTVDSISDVEDYDYSQFYFDTLYGMNGLWLKNDATYIYADNGTVVKGAKAFEAAGTKIIEIGKIYVTSGEDAGKYRLYVKADDELLVEYFSSNKLTVEKVSTTGKDQRVITIPNYEECDATHSFKHFDAVTPSCQAVGNIEYNWCKNCGKYYSADETEEITDPSTIILPMTHIFGDLVEGTPATCDNDGTYSYYECSLCHDKYSEDKTTKLDSIVEPAHHELTHHAAAYPTCEKDGNIEYWYCSECKKFFLDADCTQETKEEVSIASHHELTHYDAIAETCSSDGNIAYYHCSECGKHFIDEACTQEVDNILISKHHSYEYVKGIEPTCTTDGVLEYYECSVCHKIVDEQGSSIADIVIPKYAHTLSKTEAVAATCDEDGNVEYWTCSECEKIFSDEAGTVEITDVSIAKHHTLTYVKAVEATCKKTGNVAHYHCSECGKNFADEECTQEIKDVSIAKHVSLTYVEATKETCEKDGNVAHYHCSVCGKNFADEACTQEIKDVSIAKHHTLKHVEALSPTCEEEGNKEYWVCYNCNKRFADEACTKEITDPSQIIIAATGHDYVNGKCSQCGSKDPDYQESNGCFSAIGTSSIVFLLGFAALVFARKRKENE